MFLEIFVKGIKKGDLGWLLSKHPDNNFSRKRNGREVLGNWIEIMKREGSEEGEEAGYQVFIKNDSLQLLETLKALNKPNYVHSMLAAVCPFNLTGLREALKSVLLSSFPEEVTARGLHQQQFEIRCTLGPWPYADNSTQTGEQYGLHVLNDWLNPVGINVQSHPDLKRTFVFSAQSKMRIDEFLQKIYIVAYAETRTISVKHTATDHLGISINRWISVEGSIPESANDFGVFNERSDWKKCLGSTHKDQGKEKDSNNTQSKPSDIAKSKDDASSIDESNIDEEGANPEGEEEQHQGFSSREDQLFVTHSTEGKRVRLHDIRHDLIMKLLNESLSNHSNNNSKNSLQPQTIVDYGCGPGKLTVRVKDLFPNAHVIGLDANMFALRARNWYTKPQYKTILKVCCNLLYPILDLIPEKQKVDALICCEVIEHFHKEDRDRLMEIITRLWRAKTVIITSPNIAWNKESGIQELVEGKYRNDDHKIEYNRSEWEKEVLEVLKGAGYEVKEFEMIPGEKVQATFVCVATLGSEAQEQDEENVQKVNEEELTVIQGEGEEAQEEEQSSGGNNKNKHNKKDKSKDKNKRNKEEEEKNRARNLRGQLTALYSPFYLSETQSQVEKRHLRCGFASFEFRLQSGRNIPYLGPTIAPVEWAKTVSAYLEHPEAAFEYYRKRGVFKVSCERKYMGSRAQVVVTIERNRTNSREGGNRGRDNNRNNNNNNRREERGKGEQEEEKVNVKVFSRSGGNFFLPGDETVAKQIGAELKGPMNKHGFDFVVLDGEMLPWNYKARTLIQEQFIVPGECAAVSRQKIFGESSEEYQRAKSFVDVVKRYSEDSKTEYRVFQVLAAGKIRGKKKLVEYMGNYMPALERYRLITALCNEDKEQGNQEKETEKEAEKHKSKQDKIVKAVEWKVVDLDSGQEMEEAVEEWKRYCKHENGEGWVIKVAMPWQGLMMHDSAGRFTLPMLKVRGQDYLRIVYGVDYLERRYFEKIRNRTINGKRVLSRKQFEIAENILKAWLDGDNPLKLKMVAAFFGVDWAIINATL